MRRRPSILKQHFVQPLYTRIDSRWMNVVISASQIVYLVTLLWTTVQSPSLALRLTDGMEFLFKWVMKDVMSMDDFWLHLSRKVEDFINSSSTTPMSSVPVQFLIYVQSPPVCPNKALIPPIKTCSQVSVGVLTTFTVHIQNMCNSNVSVVTDLVLLTSTDGLQQGNLVNSTSNASLSSVTFTWTPQWSQLGFNKLCFIAFNRQGLLDYCWTS